MHAWQSVALSQCELTIGPCIEQKINNQVFCRQLDFSRENSAAIIEYANGMKINAAHACQATRTATLIVPAFAYCVISNLTCQ